MVAREEVRAVDDQAPSTGSGTISDVQVEIAAAHVEFQKIWI